MGSCSSISTQRMNGSFFEELRRRMEAKGVPSQRLLLPHVVELAPRDCGMGGVQPNDPATDGAWSGGVWPARF